MMGTEARRKDQGCGDKQRPLITNQHPGSGGHDIHHPCGAFVPRTGMQRLTSLLPSRILAQGENRASWQPCASSAHQKPTVCPNNLWCLHGNLPPLSIRQLYIFSRLSETEIIASINIQPRRQVLARACSSQTPTKHLRGCPVLQRHQAPACRL